VSFLVVIDQIQSCLHHLIELFLGSVGAGCRNTLHQHTSDIGGYFRIFAWSIGEAIDGIVAARQLIPKGILQEVPAFDPMMTHLIVR